MCVYIYIYMYVYILHISHVQLIVNYIHTIIDLSLLFPDF